MHRFWDKLPSSLAFKLLVGTCGKMHLTGLARTALNMPDHAGAGMQMLLAAWEADPLDGQLAGQLAQLLPEGDTQLRPLLSGLAAAWEPDEAARALLSRGALDRLIEHLSAKLKDDTATAFHLHMACEIGPLEASPQWVLGWFRRSWPGVPEPVLAYARAAMELLAGDAESAHSRLAALQAALPVPGVATMLGQCELLQGRRDEAQALWRSVLALRPWDVSLLLKVHDLARELDLAMAPLDGAANIFLYTFNKAAELDATLAALEKSDLAFAGAGAGAGSDSCVTVLNNGSTDGTDEVVARWQARLGSGLFRSITLPVNVGAPAARNWLMRDEATAKRPYTLYLDDDALVPPDWLGRLGAAVREYPDAGVWGCKVVDADRGHVIQNADLHPRPDYAREGEFAPGEMSDLHHQVPDLGGFDYLRPCTSVTGCCHLFRTQTLLGSDGFDLIFSPSQFDDLDHDLRLAQEGKMAVYQGHLPVRHMKRSGKLAQRGGMAYASGKANHDKLRARHGGAGWTRIREHAQETLQADLMRKMEALDGAES